MDTPAETASSFLAQALPPPQEAALLYARGRSKDAAGILERAIVPGGGHEQDLDAWRMLFDLRRAEADWRAFEQLTARFEATFGLAAPPWLVEDETAHLPPEMQHGGNAYFDPIGVLDAEAATRLEAMRRRAANHGALHLDLSKITDIQADGCLRLSQMLHQLSANGSSVVITGAERLMRLLRDAAEGNGSVPGYWFLLLELYQLRGMRSEFERTALEYALAAGATPPSWQPGVRPVIAPRPVEEKRDEPRYQEGPGEIRLRGVMAGAADPLLRELDEFAAQRRYVNINLSRVTRLDFACATSLAVQLNGYAAAGKTVRLIRPNALVGGLLASIELAPEVTIVEQGG